MLDFTFANLIAKVFILLGKVALTVVNCFMLVFIMKYITDVADHIDNVWPPIGVTALISFLCASLFLGIFENAVLALMTCLAVDMDLHDGVPQYGPATFHDGMAKIKKAHQESGDGVDEEDAEDGGKQTAKASNKV